MPQLTFIYAYPLDMTRRRLFATKDFGEYPSIDEVKKTMSHWEDIWEEINKDNAIIKALMDITKRTPVQNLECFVFGGGINPMSTPLLIPIMGRGNVARTNEGFKQALIHELLHIFVSTDNEGYQTFVNEKYSDEDISTQNHIIIYAMLYQLYELLFKQVPPDFSAEKPPSYMRAIEIVKNTGAKEIIEEYNNVI